MSVPSCFYCDAPATKLCDWVVAIEAKGFRVARIGGRIKPGEPYATLESEQTTCDRLLCEACSHQHGLWFACGEDGDIDTDDYCPQHHAEWLVHGERFPRPS